jgi:hypothetical protein
MYSFQIRVLDIQKAYLQQHISTIEVQWKVSPKPTPRNDTNGGRARNSERRESRDGAHQPCRIAGQARDEGIRGDPNRNGLKKEMQDYRI